MSQSSSKIVTFPQVSAPDALSEVLRRGARELLSQAIEQEVAEYVSARHELVDAPSDVPFTPRPLEDN